MALAYQGLNKENKLVRLLWDEIDACWYESVFEEHKNNESKWSLYSKAKNQDDPKVYMSYFYPDIYFNVSSVKEHIKQIKRYNLT